MNPQDSQVADNRPVTVDREELPVGLRYGIVRPIHAFTRDVRVSPGQGNNSYTDGQEIVWNGPTGGRQWLDGKRSYITTDLIVTLATGYNIMLDYDTQAFTRQWRVYQNSQNIEQIDFYNLLWPVLNDVSASTWDYGSIQLWSGGNMGAAQQYGVDYVDPATTAASTTAYESTTALTISGDTFQNCRTGLNIENTTGAAATYTVNVRINCPSAIIGMNQKLLYPISFIKQLEIRQLLEYGQMVFVCTMKPSATTTVTYSTATNATNKYTLSNLFWWFKLIELGADILSKISDVYVSALGPGGEPAAIYFYPTCQWIHRTSTISSGITSASLTQMFNVASAKSVVIILRPQDVFGPSDIALVNYCFSNRVGNVSSWSLLINGVSVPQATEIRNDVVTLPVADSSTMDMYRQFQHAIEGIESTGHMLSRSSILRPFLFNSLSATVATGTGLSASNQHVLLGSANGQYFISYAFEPRAVIDDYTSRAGIILANSSDITLNITFAAATLVVYRVDWFIYCDVEIATRDREVERLGAAF